MPESSTAPRLGPLVRSTQVVTEAFTKSAVPKKGTVVSSWATYASTVFLSGPGLKPTPSGIPENVVPVTVSPLLTIGTSQAPSGTSSASTSIGASLVRYPSFATATPGTIANNMASAAIRRAVRTVDGLIGSPFLGSARSPRPVDVPHSEHIELGLPMRGSSSIPSKEWDESMRSHHVSANDASTSARNDRLTEAAGLSERRPPAGTRRLRRV